MKNLYTVEDELTIKKEKSKVLAVLISLSLIFVIGAIVLIAFSSYKTMTIYKILLSIFSILVLIPTILFLSKYNYLRRLLFEYVAIENEKETFITAKIEKIGDYNITLADKSRVREIYVSFEDGTGKAYYLSEIFDNDLLEGKTYKFVISFDYIKGYELHEN